MSDSAVWLELTSVATQLGMPERTLRHWCESGRIPARQFAYDGHWHVHVETFQTLMKAARLERKARALRAGLTDAPPE